MCFKWYRKRQLEKLAEAVPPPVERGSTTVSGPEKAQREIGRMEIEKHKAILNYFEAQAAVAGLILPTRLQPPPKESK